MAQSGYTPIQLYYSTTAAAAPTAGNLLNGEMAINITDGKLYYKDNLGAVQVIATKAGANGDVVGPASSTANAIARFSGTTGKIIQNSGITIDASNNVTGMGTLGVGAITTTGVFTATAGTVSAPAITTTGDTNTGIFFPAADTIAFAEGGVEAVRIDSSGRMLVGSTTARTNLFNSTITSPLQVEGTGNDTSSTLVVRNSNDNGGPFYILAKTRGSTVGSTTVVQNDDGLGSIRFQGSDGTEFVDAAMIQVQVGGTPGANDMPGTMIFYTTADGSASPTERMRIDSSGNVTLQKNISVGGATPTTSGAGITFPATQSASSDANTLDDYEEGTWTPIDSSGAGLTFNQASGKYTKIGRQVTAWGFVDYPVTASGANLSIGGLPFTIANTAEDRSGGMLGYSTTATVASVLGVLNTTRLGFWTSAGVAVTNANASNGQFYFAITYNV